MPVVVVAKFTAKPESVDAVRAVCAKAVEEVHREPGCQLYALHQTDHTFVFIEQWADTAALTTHAAAPALAGLLSGLSTHLTGAPDITTLTAVPAGDPALGQLRP